MNERYTKVYSLAENLYIEGAPIVIVAGAILKDNQTSKILAQLKLRSITDQKIKAVKILISTFDISGHPIDGEFTYEYLDLAVERDDEFGQKIPIPLPNDFARSFSVKVTDVIFTEGGIWTGNDVKWEPIKKQKNFYAVLRMKKY